MDATPKELYEKFKKLPDMLNREYRLVAAKVIVDDLFVYYQELREQQRQLEIATVDLALKKVEPLMVTSLEKRVAACKDRYEKTAPMRDLFNTNFFGSVLIKIDPVKFHGEKVYPQWWECEPIMLCATEQEAVEASIFFNTHEFLKKELKF